MERSAGKPSSLYVLAGFFAASCAAALWGGYFTARVTITDLYAALAKPVWAPPGWLFGPVWTTLYISMSLAMWLVWKQRFEMAGRYAVARGLWWVQLLLNAAWPVFFWMHPAGFLPFLVCGTLFLCVCFCVVRFWPLSVAAATLMLPYAVWSGFATALSCALWLLNRAG